MTEPKLTVAEIEKIGREKRLRWEAHRALMDGKAPLPASGGGGNFAFSNEAQNECFGIGPCCVFRITA